MVSNISNNLDFHSKALLLRADRQRIIASNIANADTPGFVARDLNFKDAMNEVNSGGLSAIGNSATQGSRNGTTNTGHIALTPSPIGTLGGTDNLNYTTQSQSRLDGNSVDLDQQRANFVDNSVRYEATLRFINGYSKTMLSAIQGQ